MNRTCDQLCDHIDYNTQIKSNGRWSNSYFI